MYQKLVVMCSFLLLWVGQNYAQVTYDTLRWWDLSHYSASTLADLAADTERWTPMYKGETLQRYANNVSTDGAPMIASGREIVELSGLLIGEGIESGSFLLRHNMGESQNGMQMQRVAPVTILDVKQGDVVLVEIKSSSKNSAGIASVENMEGECGEGHYTSTNYKTYEFKVIADGNASFTNMGGVVVRSIGVVKKYEDQRSRVATPQITVDGDEVQITCPTEGATIYYSQVQHGEVMDYARLYDGPFTLKPSMVVLRAVAVKDGMQNSEEQTYRITTPVTLPYAGRPFYLDPEKLDRGLIALPALSGGGMMVSWRRLITDDEGISFVLYRDDKPMSLSLKDGCTTYHDPSGNKSSRYRLEVLQEGVVTETAEARILAQGYWDLPLRRPAGGETSSGTYEYVPGDCMVGDIDADGDYELIMKWDPSNQKDNSHTGYTGPVLIDCYRMDGTHLWRIDLGKNIRAGAHYTQLLVYDFDQDGCAELACKTAPGTIDGEGNPVLLPGDDATADYRNSEENRPGIVISGPEYLTVFSGKSGAALATTRYNPPRDTISNWGDTYGNRSERYLAAVAYLDGKHPSLVMCRGYYTSAFLWAVDFDGSHLSTRWLHASTRPGYGAYGEGAHSISVADVDGDGCDEIIYGACAIDDDGSLLYRTGLGHGDAMHVGDLDPDRPGLEVMMVHEDVAARYGIEMHDALTGEILSGYYAGVDVGRGLCADVDADSRGCEYWSTVDDGVYNLQGEKISTRRPSVNFRTYWDGDELEEFCETGKIEKYQGRNSSIKTLVNFSSKYGAGTNLIKYTPCLQADIWGDWREEVIYYDEETKSHLMIFSSPYACSFGVPTLMHDHHYRMATVWQTSAYNQPPHLSYYLPDYVSYIKAGGSLDLNSPTSHTSRVVSRKYYDLMGRRLMVAPQSGVVIEEAECADGTIIRKKVSLTNASVLGNE